MTTGNTNQPESGKDCCHEPEKGHKPATGSTVPGHQGQRKDPIPGQKHDLKQDPKHDKDGKPIPVVAREGDKPTMQTKR